VLAKENAAGERDPDRRERVFRGEFERDLVEQELGPQR
jgi:hypothetical protein